MEHDLRTALLGRVSRLYYDHGLTHAEIADLNGLSRVKVTRLLAEARRAGVVRIEIDSDERPFPELEGSLMENFGLRSAWVAPAFPQDAERGLASLGVAGAQCLGALLPATRRVAVGLSTSVAASVASLQATDPTELEVFPVGGSVAGRTSLSNPHELALAMATAFGGTAHYLPAPLLASTTHAARVIREDPKMHETLIAAAKADALVIGLGGIATMSGLLTRSVTTGEFAALREAGAVGDMSGRFFDAEGRPVPSDVDDRVIGLNLDELLAIPVRVAIAAGPGKDAVLRVALSHHLVDVLVTDTDSARSLLEEKRGRSVEAGTVATTNPAGTRRPLTKER